MYKHLNLLHLVLALGAAAAVYLALRETRGRVMRPARLGFLPLVAVALAAILLLFQLAAKQPAWMFAVPFAAGLAGAAVVQTPAAAQAPAAAAAQDAYAAWLETLKPIADTGDFQALVAAIKLQPSYATLLRTKDMATWAALKARQEAAKAPAEALVDTMEAAGIPVEAVTVTLNDSEAQYAAGKKKIRDVMKRAGGFMGEIPSA